MPRRSFGHLHGWRREVPPHERRLTGFGTDLDNEPVVHRHEEPEEQRQHPYKAGAETTADVRAKKLIVGLKNDIKQFTGAVASRAGVNSSRSMVYSFIPDEPPEPEQVDDYFWDSPLVRHIFTRRKFKGIGRRMRALRVIVDAMSCTDVYDGFQNEYMSILDDMNRYGITGEMNRYGISTE